MADAREYHERTNHTPDRLRELYVSPDESHRPRPCKRYVDPDREPLAGVRPPQVPALSAVAESAADPLGDTDGAAPPLDRETLATLCYEAAGVIRAVERDGETARFRAASCTGKLYHVDLYLVCGEAAGVPAGVYHFDPDAFALNRLRAGDHRGVLASATGDQDGVAAAPVTAVATSVWWRNAWKYCDRTYRHAFWDAGTVLANLLAAGHAVDLRAEVVAGFDDDAVVDLLGLDPEEEAPVALAPLGRGDRAPAATDPDPIDPETEPYSEETRDHPLIRETWRASKLPDGAAVAVWRESAGPVGKRPAGDGERVPLDPVDHETASARPLADTIRRRRSCREFAETPLSRRKLGTVLDRATRGVPGDWNGDAADGLALNDVYVLLTNVDGVPAGTYRFHPAAGELERIGDADDGTKTRLAMGQEWAGDAHVDVYCCADIDAVVEELGDRGYRLAQLEAGVVLGRLYLATYAHRRLGGTGLTFFDEEVADHLEPHASGQQPTTLFAMGVADDR